MFCPIRFDVTIVSIGNNCNINLNWPESPFGTVVKAILIGQNHPANQGNPLYNWVLIAQVFLNGAINNFENKVSECTKNQDFFLVLEMCGKNSSSCKMVNLEKRIQQAI